MSDMEIDLSLGFVGPQGPPGPQGPKGDKGDPGDSGSAQVTARAVGAVLRAGPGIEVDAETATISADAGEPMPTSVIDELG